MHYLLRVDQLLLHPICLKTIATNRSASAVVAGVNVSRPVRDEYVAYL